MRIKILLLIFTCFFVATSGVKAQSLLAAGTKITMADDKTTEIELVVEGDKVLVYNTKDKVYEEATIKSISESMVNRLVRITLESGMQITTTADMPIQAEKGWVSVDPKLTKANAKYPEVRDCKIGEFVLFYNIASTDYVEVTVIQGILQPTMTYTIELDNGDAYIANGFLVGRN